MTIGEGETRRAVMLDAGMIYDLHRTRVVIVDHVHNKKSVVNRAGAFVQNHPGHRRTFHQAQFAKQMKWACPAAVVSILWREAVTPDQIVHRHATDLSSL